jgi:hypothetical protein
VRAGFITSAHRTSARELRRAPALPPLLRGHGGIPKGVRGIFGRAG